MLLTIVDLTGHIIDSLTLTKVMDKLQTKGIPHQINDFQLGTRKEDMSTAMISLWTQSEAEKEAILAEIRPYGALAIDASPVKLATCVVAGKAPEGAYVRRNRPTEIFSEGHWMVVHNEGANQVIVVDTSNQKARLEREGNLKPGESVVIGHTGVKVLPIGVPADVNAVAG